MLRGTNDSVLVCEGVVLGILKVWVYKSVADGHTLEVEVQLTFVLEEEVVRDSWDKVASVRFTGNVKVFALELWEFLQKACQEF
jgi:hypothetical protein